MLGAGVVTSVQLVPFHISLNADAVAVICMSLTPTARHQVALTQLIPKASGIGVGADDGGVAAVVSDRMVPFHWFPKREPVASGDRRAEHLAHVAGDTRDRGEGDEVAPAGAATVASVHTVPFHVSAIGPEPDPPTARQNDAPTQETESSSSPVVADGSALGTTLHVLPFHTSASVPPPVPTFCSPTAAQNEALVHEMLFNWFDAVPAAAWASVHCTAPTVVGWWGSPRRRARRSPGGSEGDQGTCCGDKQSDSRHVCSFLRGVFILSKGGRARYWFCGTAVFLRAFVPTLAEWRRNRRCRK